MGKEVKRCEKLQLQLTGVLCAGTAGNMATLIGPGLITHAQEHMGTMIELTKLAAPIVDKGEGTEAEAMSLFKKCQETREAASINMERLQAQIASVQD